MIERTERLAATGEVTIDWNWYHGREQRTLRQRESHLHACYELYLYVQGEVSFLLDGRAYQPRRGDVLLTHPGQWHHCVCAREEEHEHFCIYLRGALPCALPPGGLIRLQRSEALLEACYRFNRRLDGGEAPPVAWAQMLCTLLCALTDEPSLSGGEKELSPRLQDVLRYVQAHYAEIPSAAWLAGRFFLSVSTLSRMFHAELGLSPYRYLEEVRMAAACRLLRENRPVTEVAAHCGFSDCSAFIGKFKRRFGVTPLKYRRESAP